MQFDSDVDFDAVVNLACKLLKVIMVLLINEVGKKKNRVDLLIMTLTIKY